MASNGIRDRVAIVGMGCTAFGERWDKSVSDLLVDSSQDALNSATCRSTRWTQSGSAPSFSGQSGSRSPPGSSSTTSQWPLENYAPPAPRPSATLLRGGLRRLRNGMDIASRS